MTEAQLTTVSSDKAGTAAARVWSNAVIMHTLLHEYAENNTLAQICLTCKQGWLYAAERLWMCARPRYMKRYRKLFNVISHQLLFKIGDHSRYGSLIKELDLSMLADRWDNIKYDNLWPILSCCVNLKALNLNMCQMISGTSFKMLFRNNPHLGENLADLEISDAKLQDWELKVIVEGLSKIKYLSLSNTGAGDDTCHAIGMALPGIESLDLSGCKQIEESCINTIAVYCEDLRYLNVKSCPLIAADNIQDLITEYGIFVDISDDDYDHGDDFDDTDDDSYDDDNGDFEYVDIDGIDISRYFQHVDLDDESDDEYTDTDYTDDDDFNEGDDDNEEN
ncbi:hypothetical protein IWW48_000860 [Coemansia sp. RSA 1200]|nr:hypothetical protein IWW48_000860 [Coemansia sp. RSA 1200]